MYHYGHTVTRKSNVELNAVRSVSQCAPECSHGVFGSQRGRSPVGNNQRLVRSGVDVFGFLVWQDQWGWGMVPTRLSLISKLPRSLLRCARTGIRRWSSESQM